MEVKEKKQSLRKIPATVITGFLGSGKTSLIQHLISTANGLQLAFIINEFGDLGVDKELLLGCGLEDCDEGDIVELANGCICCTVADDFLPTMEFLLNRPNPPEHIIIETSGLALPKPLIKAFSWPEVSARATVDFPEAMPPVRPIIKTGIPYLEWFPILSGWSWEFDRGYDH